MGGYDKVVTPAKAGVYCVRLNFETGWNAMDTGLRRYDGVFVGVGEAGMRRVFRAPPMAVDIFLVGG